MVTGPSTFMASLSSGGRRVTRQRRIVAETFFELKGHANAEELYERVRRIDPSVSRATVYRTLRILRETGHARQHKFGSGSSRFEPEKPRRHHDHLICVQCGRIAEFANPTIERLQSEAAREFDFSVLDHKLEIYGLCPDCRSKRRRRVAGPELSVAASKRGTKN